MSHYHRAQRIQFEHKVISDHSLPEKFDWYSLYVSVRVLYSQSRVYKGELNLRRQLANQSIYFAIASQTSVDTLLLKLIGDGILSTGQRCYNPGQRCSVKEKTLTVCFKGEIFQVDYM